MWKRNKLNRLILFLLLVTLSPPTTFGADSVYDMSFDEIQICNSTVQDKECKAMSCIDQCMKDEGVDVEECRMSCDIST